MYPRLFRKNGSICVGGLRRRSVGERDASLGIRSNGNRTISASCSECFL